MRRVSGSVVWMVLTAFLLAGCSGAMNQRQKAFWEGATIGAMAGGGVGAVAENAGSKHDDRDEGIPIGIIAGGIIGGIIGYLNAEEAPAPAPPPKPTPQAAYKPEPKPVPKPMPAPRPEPAPAPRPEPAPTPPAPEKPMVRERIVLRGINFDFDKAVIKPEFEPVLDEAARLLKERPDVDVIIEGHTCWIGTEAYNQGLSERRARAVYNYLVDKGVPAARLKTVGYGETRPMADNSTLAGRRLNRRVEFKVIR